MQKLLKTATARWFQFAAVPFLVVLWFVVTDPSGGADTLLRLQLWGQALVVTGVAYLVSKAILGEASSEKLFSQSMGGNSAAGLAYLGVCVLRGIVLAALLVFFALVQR